MFLILVWWFASIYGEAEKMVTKKYKQILVTVVRNHNIKKQNLTIYKND